MTYTTDHPSKYSARCWNGDPLEIPPAVVKALRTDTALADRTFINRVEAFNAGLAIGVAAARRAAARAQQP